MQPRPARRSAPPSARLRRPANQGFEAGLLARQAREVRVGRRFVDGRDCWRAGSPVPARAPGRPATEAARDCVYPLKRLLSSATGPANRPRSRRATFGFPGPERCVMFAPAVWPRTGPLRLSACAIISPRLAPSARHPPIPRPARPPTETRPVFARSPQPHPTSGALGPSSGRPS